MAKIRILIVEDEALLAMSVQRLLNRLGYDAFGVAASGDEAVEIARRERPDLIMMDIHLRGETDGIQVAERIRDFLDVPIVYTTAFSDEETVERAKKTEPSAFLLKPYDIKDLQVTIEMSYHRYRAERRIRENEHRISTILKCIDDSVVTTDNSGAVTFMNPNAERLTGWKGGEAVGKRVDEVLRLSLETSDPARLPADTPAENGDHDDRLKLPAASGGTSSIREETIDTRSLTPGQVFNTTESDGLNPRGGAPGDALTDRFRGFRSLEKRNGDIIPVECIVTPLTEEWGGTSGRVFVLRDMTAVRRDDEEKRRIETELAQSQKMETVGKFAAGIAHDFNNYLAVIGGSVELQQKTNEDKCVPSSNLKLAMDAVEKATGLTQNLLQFSRKKPFRAIEVDVNRAVENLLVLVRCILSTRIQITTELHPENPRILADPVQLEQILMNLVINARDAMSPGGRLTIRIETVHPDPVSPASPFGDPSGRFVQITVSDTGKGLPPDGIPDGTSPVASSKPSGTGFGLFIVHEIAKWHGGFVRAESTPGTGTAFQVFLPEYTGTDDGRRAPVPMVLWKDGAREGIHVFIN